MEGFLKLVRALTNIFFFCAGVVILGYALWDFHALTEWKVTSLFAYSLAMFLLAFRGSLSAFSVFGLKADLRDKINEADAVIKEVRDLAKLVLAPTMTTVAHLGRWDQGFSDKEKYDLELQARNVMRSLKISDKEVEAILLPLHAGHLIKLMYKAKKPALDLLNSKIKEKRDAHNEAFKGTVTDAEGHRKSMELLRLYEKQVARFGEPLDGHDLLFSSYDRLVEEINECSLFNEEERKTLLADKGALLDLKYYCQYKTFRDPASLSASNRDENY